MMRRNNGFTVVELMVTMAVGAILVTATVGMYLTVLSQAPVTSERNRLATQLQSALNRINDDVRRSSNVTVYNVVADPNAPTTKAGYIDVPGPDDTDTNDQHFWRMGEQRLLLNQTPVDASGNPIYTNAEYAAGPKNTIVYYVRDDALYRRVIAATATGNTASTTSCTRVPEGGCIASDIKLVDNIRQESGVPKFKIAYYDRNGNSISNTITDTTGTEVPDYTGFPLTRAIGVELALESTTNAQTISVSNTMRMQFRSELNVVPTTVVEPYIPPTNGVGSPGLMVGPGGLVVTTGGLIMGGDAYVKGKVNVGFNGSIGGGSLFATSAPVNLNVGNIGDCGSGSYPQPCGSGSQPITASAAYARIGGKVCAKDQVSATGITAAPGEMYGLIPGCTPPDVDLPTFDKSSFVAGMTNGSAAGSTVSCTTGSTSFAANRKYTGNITINLYCQATIEGSMYVTGNLTASNSGRFKVAESAGRVRPVVLVNGKISMGGARVNPNSFGTTPYFISMYSAENSCSISDTCNTISPAKLKETIDNNTSYSAPISLSNTVAQGTSFYSYFGEVNLSFYSDVGAAAGQRVYVDNSNVRMNAKL